MSTHHPQNVTHAMFSEPVFNEEVVTGDPPGLAVFHADDNAIFAQVRELLTKQVVGFQKARVADDQVFPLAQAWGAHGADLVKAIEQSGQIVFQAVGDSGATKKA